MSTPTAPLDALIAAYLQAIEVGQVPDRQQLLAGHPEHAEALTAFFADFDRMDRVAAPLRIAAESDETAALEGLGAAKPTVRYFGDYELLEEIARGGMGIVYKARQTSLNRVVALKMILAGTFATPRDVARFQAEAEAAANLDHPHIVPVYEVGEHDGQQYFSMKFIEGGSLASHPRGDLKTEVRGLITIARAVHHAHQHGVLHRDLKPSNVLVDAQGDRHVTDFGLAKRLTELDRSLTEAGQILGTPRYMSPEQASGRKDLTVAADIYSLGVILYDRLTGRTPFDGETALALLRQVRETEPPRPSTIRPGLDRDLETITLKCLEKDPARRYLAAEGLVEDLARWLEGRPIKARPVGQAERFARWCWRNPAIAGLSGLVAASLVAGTVTSTLLATRERAARIRAEKAEDDTEAAFARSLVRPLDPEVTYRMGYLIEPEVEALWELARQDGRSFGLRFLEEATRDRLPLRQLYARSEAALVASLGLDSDRRAQAIRLLDERLRQPGFTNEEKVLLSLLILELSDDQSPATDEAMKAILLALRSNRSQNFHEFVEARVIDLCDSIPATRAASLIIRCLEHSISQQITGEVSDGNYGLALALRELSTRLEPSEAATLSRSIVASLERNGDPERQLKWAFALAGLVGRLDPAEAATLCGRATRSLGAKLAQLDSPFYHFESRPAEVVTTLASRLPPAELSTVAQLLADSFIRSKFSNAHYELAEDIVSLSDRLQPGDAAMICGPVARFIVAKDKENNFFWEGLHYGLVVARLSAHLDPAEAVELCARSARHIVANIQQMDSEYSFVNAGKNFEELSARMSPTEASTIAGPLASLLERKMSDSDSMHLVDAVVALSRRLEPREADALRARTARAIAAEIERSGTWELFAALATTSTWLEPSERATLCSRASRLMADYVERDLEPSSKKHWAEALASLAPLLERVEAEALCDRASRSLLSTVERIKREDARRDLASGLSSLCGFLSPAEVARLEREVSRLFERETTRWVRVAWAKLLRLLLDRLHPTGFDREMARRLIASTFRDQESGETRAILAGPSPTEGYRRAVRLATSVLQYNPAGTLDAIIRDAIEPFPCRLSTEDLVELLKWPTCLGKPRAIVLEQLGNIHGRRFANHWEFVRFAREKGLKLDFTSPPRRPDPKASLGRLLDQMPLGR